MDNEQILSQAVSVAIKHMSNDPVRASIIQQMHQQLLTVSLQVLLSQDLTEYFTQVADQDKLKKEAVDELRFRTKLLLGLNGNDDVYAAWKNSIFAQVQTEVNPNSYFNHNQHQPWIEGLWLLCTLKGYFAPIKPPAV